MEWKIRKSTFWLILAVGCLCIATIAYTIISRRPPAAKPPMPKGIAKDILEFYETILPAMKAASRPIKLSKVELDAVTKNFATSRSILCAKALTIEGETNLEKDVISTVRSFCNYIQNLM